MDTSLLGVSAAELEAGSSEGGSSFNNPDSSQELGLLFLEGELSPQTADEVASAAGSGDEFDESEQGNQLPSGFLSRSISIADSLTPSPQPFRERLMNALPTALSELTQRVDWSRLVAIEGTEALHESAIDLDISAEDLKASGLDRKQRLPPAVALDINSGGHVFFGILQPKEGHEKEEAIVLKFCNSRHMLQSEQMAAELAWQLEIAAPPSRLLLKQHDGEEWSTLSAAANSLNNDLSNILLKKQSMLLLQFIPGSDLKTEAQAWEGSRLMKSTHALGRVLVLDMLLGNSDRLPIHSLAWRGNPSNLLWRSADEAMEPQSHCVPIDAVVSRRPPKLLVQDTDKKVECLLELVLLDRKSAQQVLLEAVSCNARATAAVEADWAPNEAAWAERQKKMKVAKGAKKGADQTAPHSAIKAFHEGVRSALSLALREQGLLEMMVSVLRSWMDTFRDDMDNVAVPGETRSSVLRRSQTRELAEIKRMAMHHDKVKDRLSVWQKLLQQKSCALRSAADDWAVRRTVRTSMSFKGFLGNSMLNPVADAYELLVRLQQLVPRVKVFATVSIATRPSDLSPSPLFVGPVTACCWHLLRKLGVTSIVNCTTDLPEPSPEALGAQLKWHRIILKDTEEQDLTSAFHECIRIIDEAVNSGGRVFLHCHEGKSRSVSLSLAYMIVRERRSLADALAYVKSKRPPARPNAGFLKQLISLELATLGCNSMTLGELPKGKPKEFICDICRQPAGLTEESLVTHKNLKHADKKEGSDASATVCPPCSDAA